MRWPAVLSVLIGCAVGAIMVAAPVLFPVQSGGASPSSGPSPHAPMAVDPQFLPTVLTSPNATDDGHYGQSIAVSGSTLVVGAPGEQAYVGGFFDDGLAYVDNQKTGATKVLTARYEGSVGAYGWSVAVDSSFVVVGAPGEGYGTTGAYEPGHVFVYNATTFSQVGSYTSPNAQTWYNLSDERYFTDDFGESVAISGNLIVVGAPGENASGQLAAGHAYVINARTGATIMLASPFPQGAALFGGSVAISGDYVMVGAPGQGIFGIGGAYLFSAITGDLLETFSSPQPSIGESFGASVAISWPTVAVGAPDQTDPNPCPTGLGAGQCGAVYLFSLVGGPTTTILSPNPTALQEFGDSLAISSGLLLVGAPHVASNGATATGEAFLYSRTTNALITSSFSPPEWPPGAVFGTSVALNATAAFVGAPNERADDFDQAGQGFVFTRIPLSISSPQPGGGFGQAVSVQGGFLAIGEPKSTVGGDADAGQAFLMSSELGPLRTFNGSEAGEEFGASVAVDSDFFAVGAPGASGGAGEVFVYYASNGTLRHTFGPGAPSDALGSSLAISGDLLAVGAPGGGYASVYNLTTDSSVVGFEMAGTNAGSSVAISGSSFVVGVPDTNVAWIVNFEPSVSWQQLLPPTGGTGSFGASVAIGGSTVVVGAPGAAGGGAAYVYARTTGAQLFSLTDTNATGGGAFGDAVADNGGTIVVGADGEQPYGMAAAGNIFLYSAGSGKVLDRYNGPVPTAGDSFGYAVAIGSGGKIMVGEDPQSPANPYDASVCLFFF